jgi:hypothetical protein
MTKGLSISFVCLEVPIHGVSEPFIWGVWVSASKASFDRYVETYNAPNTGDSYLAGYSHDDNMWDLCSMGNLAKGRRQQPVAFALFSSS